MKKIKQPTDAELAKCAGLTLEAWHQVKDMPIDKLVSVAALFGCEIGFALRPNKRPGK